MNNEFFNKAILLKIREAGINAIDFTVCDFMDGMFNNYYFKVEFDGYFLYTKNAFKPSESPDIDLIISSIDDVIFDLDGGCLDAFNDRYFNFIEEQLLYRLFFESKRHFFVPNNPQEQLISHVFYTYPKIEDLMNDLDNIDLSSLKRNLNA